MNGFERFDENRLPELKHFYRMFQNLEQDEHVCNNIYEDTKHFWKKNHNENIVRFSGFVFNDKFFCY